MDSWYRLNIGDGQMAYIPLADIQSQFEQLRETVTDTAGMAILKYQELEGGLQCSVTVYFSPRCQKLAKALGAAPCPNPDLDDLTLIAGAL